MKYDSDEYRKFEQERIDAGKLIDPRAAKLRWRWGDISDVYGVLDEEQETNIGRIYFLRAHDSDMWVNIYDLPDDTRDEFRRLLDAGYYNDGDDDLVL
jgi:hypothetical protein